MSTYIDICGDSSATKNTGASSQCLEKATVTYALAKSNFTFDDLAAIKTKAAWETAKQNKDIVMFFSVEAQEISNTDPTYVETRTLKVETAAARKGKLFTHHLDLISHAALKSYENSDYKRVFEITEEGYVKGVLNSDGTIKGQLLSSFKPSLRQDATFDAIATSTVELAFKDYNEFEDNGVITEPAFDIVNYDGIFPVKFEVVSTSATQIVVKATAGASEVSTLVLANFALKTAAGAAQTISGVTKDGNTYTLSGTGFVSGTLGTDGVIVQANIMYEGETATISI